MKLNQLIESQQVAVPIYRGIKLAPDVAVGDILTMPVRQDRKPTDSSILSSMLFNYGIQCRFGIPDIRKTSVFASGSLDIARQYGGETGKGVGQVMLPIDSVVVYNPAIMDSLIILDSYAVNDYYHRIRRTYEIPDVDVYLSKNSGELFHEYMADEIQDPDQFIDEMRKFEELALKITEGYQMRHASDLEVRRASATEYIINGISSYNIRILERDGKEVAAAPGRRGAN